MHIAKTVGDTPKLLVMTNRKGATENAGVKNAGVSESLVLYQENVSSYIRYTNLNRRT